MSDAQDNKTRDEGGRFRSGASGNPHGRPPKAREQAYLDTLKERLSLEAWGQIVDEAIEAAKGGDDKARTWLGDYAIGRPKQTIAISNQNGADDEFGQLSDEELHAIANSGAGAGGVGGTADEPGGEGKTGTGKAASG